MWFSQIKTEEKGFTPFESPVSVTCDNEVTLSACVYNSRTGFTLVETLVAIAILLVIIVGPMSIAQKGIQNAFFAREQLTAVFLAQEAIEGVRELRDNDAIYAYGSSLFNDDTESWLSASAIPTACRTSGCAYDNGSIEPCNVNNDCLLEYDSASGLYTHGGGVDSIFTRTVTVGESINGGVPVTVSVTWAGKVRQGKIVLQSWIYDHYQRYED